MNRRTEVSQSESRGAKRHLQCAGEKTNLMRGQFTGGAANSTVRQLRRRLNQAMNSDSSEDELFVFEPLVCEAGETLNVITHRMLPSKL